jgi:hypothetical protein
MKTIKYILVIIVLVAVISLATTDAIARGHGHTSVRIGVGFGYPYWDPWYEPYHGYYGGYYGYPYYPYDYPDVIVESPVIVQRPSVIVQPAAPAQVYSAPEERLIDGQLKTTKTISNPTFTVWVTNDNGSRTPVTLRPQGTGFVGPSNEYYSTMPTEEQLKPLYGLKSNVPPADTTTVWLNNCDGTKIPVVLTKDGSEYIGPKGEHYAVFPTEDQLKAVYSQAVPKVKSDSVVVWIDNGDGSKTPITLQKEGSNYIGPAGEKYTSLPTGDQLKVLYCSSSSASQTGFNFEITKADGTKVIVAIKKEGTEFVGPKGEHYPSMPTEEQLKLIYGK